VNSPTCTIVHTHNIVLYLYIYIVPLAVHTNQCERPREMRAIYLKYKTLTCHVFAFTCLIFTMHSKEIKKNTAYFSPLEYLLTLHSPSVPGRWTSPDPTDHRPQMTGKLLFDGKLQPPGSDSRWSWKQSASHDCSASDFPT